MIHTMMALHGRSLRRHVDWAERLVAYLIANSETHFRYGQFDCCLFSSGAIEAMTGTDLAAPFRGRYDSLRGAARAIRSHCGSISIAAVASKVAAEHGMAEVAPLCAGRGDLVLIRRPQAMGIVSLNGREIVVLRPEGLCSIPLTEAARAWRV